MNKKLIFSLALTFLLTSIATATTRYVPSGGTPNYANIKAAITASVSGDEVIVADGTYTSTIADENRNLDFGGRAITVRSANGPANCIIDCGGVPGKRAFYFHNGETPASVVQGFTIINGNAGTLYYGGAIECEEASATIDNCIIKNNTALYGGAIDCFYASPVITHCIITNNSSTYDGGAIECGSESEPEITNCLFAGNTAISGYGTIDCYDFSSPVIINCTIANNTGNSNYGGIYSTDATATIRNSILWNNGDDIYGSGVTVTYSCIQDSDSGAGNIHTDPMFRTGPLGNYYLSQTAAGQLANSDCVNRGMETVDEIFGPGSSYTTRTDVNQPDTGRVDLGFHYSNAGTTVPCKLISKVDTVGTGTVDPNYPTPGHDYKQFSEVSLHATPASGYKFKQWKDANTPPSTYHITPGPNEVFIVTMNANKTVVAEFSSLATYKLIPYVRNGNGSIINVDPNDFPDPNAPPTAYFIPKDANDPNHTPVIITAKPDAGYVVKQWFKGNTSTFDINNIDPIPGSGNSLTTTIDANTTIVVEFKYQQYMLNTIVSGGHGTLSPKRGLYPVGTPVELIAHPDDGYRVSAWTGDANNKPAWNVNTNGVVMDADKTVTVQFQLGQNRLIQVFGDVNGIQNALSQANNGDTIQIHPGTYVGTGFNINKVVTIVGDPEHPENVVIDCNGEYQGNRGFVLVGQPGNSNPVTLNGVTIINYKTNWASPIPNPFPIPKPGTNGLNGFDNFGGAILIAGNHIVKNCIIRNCSVAMGPATNGFRGGDPNLHYPDGNSPNGGYGGAGGSAGGAGIYILFGNPDIMNVSVENCRAVAGNAGNGASGYSDQNDFTDTDPRTIYRLPGTSGYGGKGGDAIGAGICIVSGSPHLTQVTVRNCIAVAGNGGNGASGSADASGANGGLPGRVKGAGIYCAASSSPVFVDCIVENCKGYGGLGGNGGDSGQFQAPTAPGVSHNAGYGGLTTDSGSGQGDIRLYSTNGGAVFCDNSSNAAFTNCTFTYNMTYGSISGIGGYDQPYRGQYQPRKNYRAPSFGAGVFCSNNSSTIFNGCSFENNRTAYNQDYDDPNYIAVKGRRGLNDTNDYDGEYTGQGGGLCLWYTHTAEVNNCNLSQNSAPTGGGIYAIDSDLHVIDCNIANNIAYSGAGILTLDSTAEITKSYIRDNSAGTQLDASEDIGYALYGTGGGVYALSSIVDINDTTISGNSARMTGGGICIDGDWLYAPYTIRPVIKNCLITGNTAVDSGGGIASIYFAEPNIQNCTIADNIVSDANSNGGGLFCSYQSDTIVKDTIFWGNSGIDGSQIALSDGGPFTDMPASLTITYSDIDMKAKTGFDLTPSGSGSGSGTGSVLVDQQTIYDAINSSGTAKIIVTLVQPTEAETTDWTSCASVSTLQAKVAAQQAQVLSTLGTDEFTLRQKPVNIAAFSGSVTVGGLNKLLTNSRVTHIEPVRTLQLALAQGIPLMNALNSRAIYNGQGISIAIVDTGVDYTHPRLGGGGFPNSKVIGGYDTGNNDTDPMPVGVAHGTCCAGIVAGSLGTAGDYIGGVAYNAKIYALKASPDNAGYFFNDATLAAWDWCITHRNDNPANPIKVISNSWGTTSLFFNNSSEADAYSPAHTIAAQTAVNAGITILGCSQNQGQTNGICWPSAMSNVISVGAVYDAVFVSVACGVLTQRDQVTCYSNTANILDLLAPSENAYTTDIVGSGGYSSGDYVPNFSGTSAACPYAAGGVAALQSAAKQIRGVYLTPYQVKTILTMTGTPVTDTKVAITKPRVNLGAAIALLSPSIPVYTERSCTITGLQKDVNDNWTVAGSSNIAKDPNFVLGYYLSSREAGQDFNSPCFDIGSTLAANLGLDTYTTRTDGVKDTGIVDLGYHYSEGVPKYDLRVDINGIAPFHGTIKAPWPAGHTYHTYMGQIVKLEAVPDANYRVATWFVDDVNQNTHSRTLSIVMNKDRKVAVKFELYLPHNLIVPDEYSSIQQAIDAAENGDTIYVYKKPDGQPHFITDPCGINFEGKAIRLRSEDPNDPSIVAQTIIDCNGAGRAFIFQNNEDANSIIEGLTITNCLAAVVAPPATQYDVNGVDASGNGYGGAIYCDTGTSPTIRKCVFSNCQATGGQGSDGLVGYSLITNDQRPRGGNGGNGGNGTGNGYGGVIYCNKNSSPTIFRCTFSDCIARGGIGGNGGNGGNGSTGKIAGDGGNGGSGSGNGYGAAIYFADGAKPKISGCTFSNNLASLGLGGAGGLQGSGQIPTTAPYAYPGYPGSSSGAGFAGVIYYEKGASADINDCNFVNNTVDADTSGQNDSGGGAIYFEKNCGSITIYNSALTGNKTIRRNGGAIRLNANNDMILKNCYIGGNSATDTNSNGGALAIGSDNDSNSCGLNFISCAFTGNTAGIGSGCGGAIYAKNFDANFVNCYINRNTAAVGGGLYLVSQSTAKITGGTITQNKAVGDGGEGGGAYISNLPVNIVNCQITGNTSTYSSGGIMLKGPDSSASTIHNCLFAENSTGARGGAIFVSLNSSPIITSCTFSKNGAQSGGAGGAIFCTNNCSPTIKDCIFDNTGRIAIYENSSDCRPAISYCLFNENTNGDLYDFGTDITYKTIEQTNPDVNLAAMNLATGGHNIIGDPNFVSGPLGSYYLMQHPAYTKISPAVDAGSANAAAVNVLPGQTMADYTTRADDSDIVNAGDTGRLDIGFHYIDIKLNLPKKYQLTTAVLGGHGGIAPLSGLFYAGTTVEVNATPDAGWRIDRWTGTDNDSTTNTINYVVMIADRYVTVSFEQPKNLYVPTEYPSLQYAINDAKNGDTIKLAKGLYFFQETNYDYDKVYINGKNITITGTNPDDPCVVAQTILSGNGFYIFNVNKSMILDGITIQDAHYWPGLVDCSATWAHGPGGDGYNGYPMFGGAVSLYNASPTIRNCRFVNCSALASNACDGTGDYGDGGWAGFAWGGAVAINSTSNPIFKNCSFINCYAQGSNGGNGGGRWGHGGNWGDPNGNNNDPYYRYQHTWDFAPQGGYQPYWYYSGYGGAIYCMGGSKTQFEKCLFQGNHSYGGVCGISGTNRVGGIPNYHYALDSFGGAVYLANGSEAKFTDCNFVGNEAHTRGQIPGSDANIPNTGTLGQVTATLFSPVVSYGGAVCAEGSNSKPVFNNCIFRDNRACAGGGMYEEDSIAYMSNSTFENCSAMLGGGLLLTDSNSGISSCTFRNNLAISPSIPLGEGGAGQGGGIYCASSAAKFFDCQIMDNNAAASGGGVYFTGELEPNMHNCLIVNNYAKRDGAGVSANWNTYLTLSNCTIANNTVNGRGFASGYGGGLSCAYDAYTNVINSILWNNSAGDGTEISIGSNFDAADKRVAEVNVSYSDVKGGAAGVFVDSANGCLLVWGAGNLSGTSLTNPRFVSGPWGDYYLSQIDSNDPHQSPCVDAGLGSAVDNGMYKHTTRTNHVIDSGVVDMGYHYTLASAILGDFNFDGVVDFRDLVLFKDYWMADNCTFPYWCFGRDLNQDDGVDFIDYAIFADNWGGSETTPPNPNPMTWAVSPRSAGLTSITMTATTAKDNSGSPVKYYFECISVGGHNRDWDTNSTYPDTGLTTGTEYGYRVKARDAQLNETDWSVIGYAIAGEDSSPPEPNPMTWASEPCGISSTSIRMVATTAIDYSGVEYYFHCITPGGHDSNNNNWQNSNTYVDTSLDPCTTYSYVVKARDKSPLQNETAYSTPPASAKTLPPQPEYTLDVNIVGSGTVSKDPNQAIYLYGDVVQLTANPAHGSSFSGWSGDLTGSNNPKNITINGNKIVTATFDVNDINAPDPIRWLVTPYYIIDANGYYRATMTADTAYDIHLPIQYRFLCSYGLLSGGWQSGTKFDSPEISTNSPNNVFWFEVQDGLGNTGVSPKYDMEGNPIP